MAKGDPALLEERLARLRQLLETDSGDATSWFDLGGALLGLGRPAEAIEPLRRAIALDGDHTAAYRDLGRALLETGRSVEAAEVFARAVSLAEKNGDHRTGREIHVFLRRAEKFHDRIFEKRKPLG